MGLEEGSLLTRYFNVLVLKSLLGRGDKYTQNLSRVNPTGRLGYSLGIEAKQGSVKPQF